MNDLLCLSVRNFFKSCTAVSFQPRLERDFVSQVEVVVGGKYIDSVVLAGSVLSLLLQLEMHKDSRMKRAKDFIMVFGFLVACRTLFLPKGLNRVTLFFRVQFVIVNVGNGKYREYY
jgi:hypothetical protein